MALYRFTMILQQVPYGWSETYFATADTPSAAVGLAAFLAPKRLALCPQSVTLVGIRVSNDAIRGDAQLANFSTDTAIPQNGTLGNVPGAETEETYLVRAETQAPTLTTERANSRRILGLRGLPEAIILAPNQLDPNPPATGQQWYGALDRFLGFLRALPGTQAGPWQLRQQVPYVDPVSGSTSMNTLVVDPVDPRYMTVTTDLSVPTGNVLHPSVRVGDRVLIRGIADGRGVNGQWIVNSVTGTGPYTYRLGPHREFAAYRTTPLTAAGGTINYLTFAGVNIIRTVDLHRLSTRETGRPFGQPVGRRRSR